MVKACYTRDVLTLVRSHTHPCDTIHNSRAIGLSERVIKNVDEIIKKIVLD